MSWNKRVTVSKTTYKDIVDSKDVVEYLAEVVEVYYLKNDSDRSDRVGYSNPITPSGLSTESQEDALIQLKRDLELQLEAVNYVLTGKTPVFNVNDADTYIPGEPSELARAYEQESVESTKVLDKDDAYYNEKYSE